MPDHRHRHTTRDMQLWMLLRVYRKEGQAAPDAVRHGGHSTSPADAVPRMRLMPPRKANGPNTANKRTNGDGNMHRTRPCHDRNTPRHPGGAASVGILRLGRRSRWNTATTTRATTRNRARKPRRPRGGQDAASGAPGGPEDAW